MNYYTSAFAGGAHKGWDYQLTTVESPNKGHFGTNINSSGLSTV